MPCFPEGVEGCLHVLPWFPGQRMAALEIYTPTPKCSPCPWDTRFGLEGEPFQRDRQGLQQPRQQREFREEPRDD